MRVELGWPGRRTASAGPWILLAAGVAIAAVLPLFAAGLRLEASIAAVGAAFRPCPALPGGAGGDLE